MAIQKPLVVRMTFIRHYSEHIITLPHPEAIFNNSFNAMSRSEL